jgi:hypothetical protein
MLSNLNRFVTPAPHFCGDKFTPAKAGAGMTSIFYI